MTRKFRFFITMLSFLFQLNAAYAASTVFCFVGTESPTTSQTLEAALPTLGDGGYPDGFGGQIPIKAGFVTNPTVTTTKESAESIISNFSVTFNPPLTSTERNNLFFYSIVTPSNAEIQLNTARKINDKQPRLTGNNCFEAEKLRYVIPADGKRMFVTAYYHQRQLSGSDCDQTWDTGASQILVYFARNPQVGGTTDPGVACSALVNQPEFVP